MRQRTNPPDPPVLPAKIYRIGRNEDAWSRRKPIFGVPSGSRYDDPLGRYRTIYAASSRYEAYIAALAEFRPGPNADDASKIELDERDKAMSPSSQLDAVQKWITRRYIGEGTLNGRFVDLTNEKSLAFLRERLAKQLEQRGISRFDRDSVAYAPREITMEISRCFYQLEFSGYERFDGLIYRSRLAGGMQRWAIFAELDSEPAALIEKNSSPISLDDPDLIQAIIDCEIDSIFPSASNVWNIGGSSNE